MYYELLFDFINCRVNCVSPIQIFFANDSEVIGAASILFIVCAITFVIPYRMLTFEYWEYEDDTHYKNVDKKPVQPQNHRGHAA